jgi:glucose-6-phosphate 1-epimerase
MEIKKFQNGFEYIEIRNNSAYAKIALQGGHLFHYAHNNKSKPIIWLSDESEFQIGTAIRGGIPICWPSFGMNNKNLAQHGFARVSIWNLISVKELDSCTTQVVLKLTDTQESLRLWNYKFSLELKITISETLIIEMQTTNLDKKPFTLTQAFHTYFNISNISNISISGLDSKPYLNALNNLKTQQKGDIKFVSELDRVYQEVDSEIILNDIDKKIKIYNEGSSSVVVWNPWVDKCRKMSFMDANAFKEFVCIESANAFDDYKILDSKKSHILKTIIKIV